MSAPKPTWELLISRLERRRGVPAEFIEAFIDAGPESYDAVRELVEASDQKVAEVVRDVRLLEETENRMRREREAKERLKVWGVEPPE